MSTRSQRPIVQGEVAPAGVNRGIRHRTGHAQRSTVVSIVVVVYLFAAGVAWAMITPIGGVPDEPAHITYSAAVVRGDLGVFAVVDHPYYTQLAVVTVPEWVASITDPPRSVDAFPFPCFGGADEQTANCAPTLSQSTAMAKVPTTVTRYPPPYYWIVGLPTLMMAGEPAVYSMRIISAALATSMVALGLAAASPSRRTWLALGTAVAFTPMVGHFAGSVNPSGFEITAAMGLGIGLMGIIGTDHRNHRRTATLIITLAFALAWSRPRTYLVLIAVIAAAALINTDQLRQWLRNRTVRYTILIGVALSGVTAFGYQRLYTNPETVADAPVRIVEGSIGQPLLGLVDNLHELERRFTEWGLNLIGHFGWLDHWPPRSVWIAWGVVALALMALAVAHGRRRDRAALITVGIGALILAPLFVVTNVLNALVYQARYHLALAVLIPIAAVTILSGLDMGRARATAWNILSWGATLAPIVMGIIIVASLHRYGVGGEAQLASLPKLLFGTRQWLPPAEPGVLGIASAVIMLFMTAALYRFTQGPTRE